MTAGLLPTQNKEQLKKYDWSVLFDLKLDKIEFLQERILDASTLFCILTSSVISLHQLLSKGNK